MTTIATDGKTVAFDGLATGGGITRGLAVEKAWHVTPTVIVAASGTLQDAHIFRDWVASRFTNSAAEKPKLDEAFSGIVVDVEKGLCQHYSDKLMPMETLLPFAIGSGDEVALGAMLAGADPLRAVELACTRDVYSGGVVRALPDPTPGDRA